VRIFASELRVLIDELHRHPHVETGGDLYGLWSHGDTPTIFLATRPGAGAVRERMSFQQDVHSHRAVEGELWKGFGVQCVGMWHSHHRLGLNVLSAGDLARTMRYARRSKRDRFVDVLGFVQEAEWALRPFLYRDAAIGRTRPTLFDVLAGVSPIRAALRDATGPFVDAPVGPPVPYALVEGEAQSVHIAPTEGASDPRPQDFTPAPAGGRGPWRTVDRVERLVGQVVPERMLGGLELDLLDDNTLALRLSHRDDRSLVALFESGDELALRAWEVVGPRPVKGVVTGTTVAESLQRAVKALENG